MQRAFGFTRILATGAPAPSATVTVYNAGTLVLSTIYGDNLAVPTPKANPFTADANGYWFFYALTGLYDLQFSGGGIVTPYTLGDVAVSSSADLSALNASNLTSGTVPDARFPATLPVLSGVNLTNTGGFIGYQIISATGAYTYTPTAGTRFIVIELQGAGGGGGGVVQPGGTSIALGTGGGGGGWLRKLLTTAFSGATGVVGALGAGGAAGNNAGIIGADTTFIQTGGGTTYTASGGSGGAGGSASANAFNASGAAGGTTTNGDNNLNGQGSIGAIATGLNNLISSRGGKSMYSRGAGFNIINGSNSSAAGPAATGNGGGGGGAIANGTGAAAAGGDGTNGLVIIYEYK